MIKVLENNDQHLLKVTVETLEDLQDVRHQLSILFKDLGSFLPEGFHEHRICLGLIHQQVRSDPKSSSLAELKKKLVSLPRVGILGRDDDRL